MMGFVGRMVSEKLVLVIGIGLAVIADRSLAASYGAHPVTQDFAVKRLNFSNGTIGDYQYPTSDGDFGKDAFGWLEVRSKVPQPCVLRIGEQLNADGTVNVRPSGTIRGCVVTCEVSSVWARVPFVADWRNTQGTNGMARAIVLPTDIGVLMPFRYVQKEPGSEDLEMRRVFVHWPMTCEATCPVDNLAAKEVWDFCQYSIVATSFAGIMVDGDRERIPYEADIYINMMGQLYGLDGNPELGRRSIRHVLKHPTWPTEWKQHAIMCVWEDWNFTGSTALAAECYALLKNEKLMLKLARPDGLLPSAAGDIVDWPVGERDGYDMKTPCNTVVNAFHFRNLREMADLARVLGKTEDASLLTARAERVRRRFNELFYDFGQGLYVDGEGSHHASLHANVAALDFGLVPKGWQDAVVDFIEKRGMVCSPYFAQYYLEALCKYGRKDVALRLMTSRDERSWLGMIDQGATMTMEAWSQNAKPNQDWNHAWGAVPLNILARFWNNQLQENIDCLAAQGGGTLVLKPGRHESGALFFKPGVNLHLEEGAVLVGRDDAASYPKRETRIEGETCEYYPAVVNADRCDGFRITGSGTIDGHGAGIWEEFWRRLAEAKEQGQDFPNKALMRPRVLYVSNSRDVKVSGVTLKNSKFWTSHFYNCEGVQVVGCKIVADVLKDSSGRELKGPSTDAVDVDKCRNVCVSNCVISVNDDGVAIKGGKGAWADDYAKHTENGPSENVVISECRFMAPTHSCLTLGSECPAATNIVMRNCRVEGAGMLVNLKMRTDTPQHYQNVLVENCSGSCGTILSMKPWVQYAKIERPAEQLKSYVSDVVITNCCLAAKKEADVIYDGRIYEASKIMIEGHPVEIGDMK